MKITDPTTWFGKTESKEKATKTIDHVGEVFMVLGGIEVLMGSFVFEHLPFESRLALGISGAIYVILGFLLRKTKKTIIAIIIFLLSIFGLIVTSLNLFGILGDNENSGAPIIGIAITVASIQAIKATRKYNQ